MNTYAAWNAAPPGTFGIVLDHSPSHEPFGAYDTREEAEARLTETLAAQSGTVGWVVQK